MLPFAVRLFCEGRLSSRDCACVPVPRVAVNPSSRDLVAVCLAAAMADAAPSIEQTNPAVAESTRFDFARGLARRRGLARDARRNWRRRWRHQLVMHLIIGAAADVEQPAG